jgi:hypothetical protein
MSSNRVMLGKKGICWSNMVISSNQKNRYADCEHVLDPVQNRQFLLDALSLGNRSLLSLLRFEKILSVQRLLKEKEKYLVEENNFF